SLQGPRRVARRLVTSAWSWALCCWPWVLFRATPAATDGPAAFTQFANSSSALMVVLLLLSGSRSFVLIRLIQDGRRIRPRKNGENGCSIRKKRYLRHSGNVCVRLRPHLRSHGARPKPKVAVSGGRVHAGVFGVGGGAEHPRTSWT